MTRRLKRPRKPQGRLRLQLDAYRTVADCTFDWEVWIGPTGQTLYVSPSCRRVSGHDSAQALADPDFFRTVIHPEDYPAWRELMDRCGQGQTPSLDFRVVRPDGRVAWVAQETTRVTDPAGRYRGLRLSLRDVTDRVAAQAALTEAREQLEHRVRERTRELHQANRELRREITRGDRARKDLERSRERFRDLSRYLQERVEDERKRISREIHDELGQNLTALNMGLCRLEAGLGGRDTSLDERLALLRRIAAGAVATVQRISRELRPAILDELGLAEALEWLARDFRESAGLDAVVRIEADLAGLGPETATALYRVCQEALTNVARHAGASRVAVGVGREPGRLTLTVEDDGQGIADEALDAPVSFGLIGMRERVRALGGDMVIGRGAGGGTRLAASVPLARSRTRKAGPS